MAERSKMAGKDAGAELPIEILEESFALLAPEADELVDTFYENLLANKEIRPLFAHVDMEGQKKHLINGLVLVVENLRKPEKLATALRVMGERHQGYGVLAEHYPVVGKTLLGAMEELAGEAWTAEVESAWSDALNLISNTMLTAYKEENAEMVPETVLAENLPQGNGEAVVLEHLGIPALMVDDRGKITHWNKAVAELTGKSEKEVQGKKFWMAFYEKKRVNPVDSCLISEEMEEEDDFEFENEDGETISVALQSTPIIDEEGDVAGAVVTLQSAGVGGGVGDAGELIRLQSAVEGSAAAIMMVDRELEITYANTATRALLTKHIDEFRSAFPRFNPDKLIGTCIDAFHKDPSHQRRILDNPRNLPYQADIKIGNLTFALNITAIEDGEDNYLGNNLEWSDVTDLRRLERDAQGQLEAIGKSQAVIQFNMDGTIIEANDNFLSVMGYSHEEVQGQHHSIFVDPEYRNSPAYQQFWVELRRGEYQADEFKRIAKGGKEVWIQASYNPIMDADGKPFKVVKYATDITEQKLQTADFSGQIEAIGKSQAVIQFKMDGTIIEANKNFLEVVGYSLEEVQGQHHSIFVDPEYRNSPAYQQFWDALRRGEYQADEFKRMGKGGKEVWIQASYNPIMDADGKPFKVVKYATDITEQKLQTADFSGQIEAIGKSQAVIQFNMDGTIIDANDNFLGALGYSLKEIQGQHHSLFVDPEYRNSPAYQQFWDALRRGEYQVDEFMRLGKGGKEVWIQASYNPIMDSEDRPFKVVKYATDITEEKIGNIRYREEVEALITEAKAGNLSHRADLDKLNTVYRPMMEGIHAIIDAIVQPIQEATGVLESLANRDLSARVVGDYLGDHARIKDALNTAAANLDTSLKQVSSASGQVNAAATEISSGSQSLAEGSSEQASSLEQVSSNLEEVSSMTKQNSANTDEARAVTESARSSTSRGVDSMNRLSEAMNKIKSSADETAKIIKTIDEIAFQTNLLALNAAVEAARAGEAGKGFAVVAEEVRNLAMRSAEAAKNTAEMIQESVVNAEGGVSLNKEVIEHLQEIDKEVEKVASVMAEIATSSGQQTTAIDQISSGVSQMNQVTQQNAANAEESAAASEELSAQAAELKALVNAFNLSIGG
jgi:methyl-accepting chemotaxis protein